MRAALVETADSALHWRELGPDDIEAVEALHRLAVGPVVRPDIVKPESRSYFESILAGRGRVIGGFDQTQADAEHCLVAYGILQHEHAPKDNWEMDLNVAPGTATGRLAGASVAPAFRGRGLQRATIAARVAMAPRAMLLFSTAAPINTPSWASLLAEGFPIHGLVRRYGGYARYLMVRDHSLHDSEQAISVDPTDIAAQLALFEKGWHGFARTRLPSGLPGILFAPPIGRHP
ncbi:hypothetical protein [Aquabacter sediminis]|uniref:hypothetical protein n=1 Tax=Aquabacter sediminis TaxID=3029197 RepID=UPI00237E439C|nr:hypothetical protein [Aquabacter sp. P-9]MDE1568516.1 hypothetical protein [Aquabacter sp. P-9]